MQLRQLQIVCTFVSRAARLRGRTDNNSNGNYGKNIEKIVSKDNGAPI